MDTIAKRVLEKEAADLGYRDDVNVSVAMISENLRRRAAHWSAPPVGVDHEEITRIRGKAVEFANKRMWDESRDAVELIILLWARAYDRSLYQENKPVPPFAELVDQIVTKVGADIDHHFDKYGPQRLDLANWLMVIVEEEGEAVYEIDYEKIRKEIMQTIACWMRFYAEIDREQSGVAEQERAWYVRAV